MNAEDAEDEEKKNGRARDWGSCGNWALKILAKGKKLPNRLGIYKPCSHLNCSAYLRTGVAQITWERPGTCKTLTMNDPGGICSTCLNVFCQHVSMYWDDGIDPNVHNPGNFGNEVKKWNTLISAVVEYQARKWNAYKEERDKAPECSRDDCNRYRLNNRDIRRLINENVLTTKDIVNNPTLCEECLKKEKNAPSPQE